MKRLLQIGFDTLLLSIIPIIMWNVVGLIFEKDIANVFAITYPIQFIFSTLHYLFGVGANVTAEIKKDKNIVYTNMVTGLFIGLAIVIILIINIEKYLTFMNSNYKALEIFTVYSIINMFYSFILKLILEKIYYEKKNNLANKISIIFNIFNLVLFVAIAFITKNQFIIIVATSVVMGIILLILFICNLKKFKFCFELKQNTLYSSTGMISNLAMFITYFIGQYNEFSFGSQYILVFNLISFTTDTQWDMLGAIPTVTHIDASKNEFNMKQQVKNAYQLSVLLIFSSVVMSLGLYPLYQPDIKIFLIAFLVQVVHMLLYPIYAIRIHYLQIKAKETNTKPALHTGISKILRGVCSFIHNPYCTYIGQIVGAIYFYFYTKAVSKRVKEIQ